MSFIVYWCCPYLGRRSMDSCADACCEADATAINATTVTIANNTRDLRILIVTYLVYITLYHMILVETSELCIYTVQLHTIL